MQFIFGYILNSGNNKMLIRSVEYTGFMNLEVELYIQCMYNLISILKVLTNKLESYQQQAHIERNLSYFNI